MRQRLIVGNWKMNLLQAEALALVDELESAGAVSGDGVEVVICPPYTALAALGGRGLSSITLGAQNCHARQKGAFTGEISAEMLTDAGCRYVILGHSERRRDQHETDVEIGNKANHALHSGLRPIICLGEQLEERQSGRTHEVINRQIDGIIGSAGAQVMSQAVVAYEPVWAIGTGLAATAEQAQEVHSSIREHLIKHGVSGTVPLLYGGSVTGGNAADLFACADIDGALVGGASLKAPEFAVIVQHARDVR
ncbi:MAG: triose-phosphate isomerase [Bacteroidota bacterium]|jgi:triosephosphate isomerase